jgi:hypothetical protein
MGSYSTVRLLDLSQVRSKIPRNAHDRLTRLPPRERGVSLALDVGLEERQLAKRAGYRRFERTLERRAGLYRC